MQSSVSDGYRNIGLYFLDKSFKEKYGQYESDWNEFTIKYCKRFSIDFEVGQQMFELESTDTKWIELSNRIK
ncbi:hypothetical protein CEQ90_19955 [Lewinellaceae bacterium SD302]|nr:hypothetical protein CEQ90_19955 [Lewinellaceae bacterium SD302]